MPLAQRILHLATSYSLRVVLATAVQLVLILGPFVLIGAAMQVVALWRERWTERLLGRRMSWMAGGWLATALHELGHALFALLFGHEITGVKLFDFQARDGALGRIDHSYDAGSAFQRLGLLAIGLGPGILATLVLSAATRWLLGIHVLEWTPTVSHPGHLSVAATVWSAVGEVHAALRILAWRLRVATFRHWSSWIFVYVALVASSAMRLSAADLRSAGKGAWTLAWMVALLNALTLWTGFASYGLALRAARDVAFCVTELLAALVLQLILAFGARLLLALGSVRASGAEHAGAGAV